MKKIDIKLVNDYINGNELPFEELENDIDFMESVLVKSKDKKMFNFSSDELKNNIEYIIFTIELFKDDIKFITNIVDEYLKNNLEASDEKAKLLVLICQIINDDKDEKYIEYVNELKIIYTIIRVEFEIIKENLKVDDESKESLQKGYSLLNSWYSYDELLVKSFSRLMIEKIFEEKRPLEKYFHEHYTSINTLREYGVKKLIIDIINTFDYNLGYYVMGHMDLVETEYQEINSIFMNWENYESNLKRTKYNIIYDYVHNYLVEYKLEELEHEILHLIGIELNINEDVKQYLNGSDTFIIDDGDVIEIENEYLIDSKSELDFYTLRHYEELKEYIRSIIFDNKVDEDDSTDNKCNIFNIKRGN